MFGTWQIPTIELAVSGYFNYLSGRTYTPFQRFGSSAINYPTSAGRQPFLEPRGTRRLDSESYLDLRVEKIFKLGAGTNRLSVYADFQNVFNEGTVHLGERPLAERGDRRLRRPDRRSGRRSPSSRRAGSCSARAGASSHPARPRPAATGRELKAVGRRPRGP